MATSCNATSTTRFGLRRACHGGAGSYTRRHGATTASGSVSTSVPGTPPPSCAGRTATPARCCSTGLRCCRAPSTPSRTAGCWSAGTRSTRPGSTRPGSSRTRSAGSTGATARTRRCGSATRRSRVTAMVAAVLGRVGDEAVRVSGVRLDDLSVTLTHPAGWDGRAHRRRCAGPAGRPACREPAPGGRAGRGGRLLRVRAGALDPARLGPGGLRLRRRHVRRERGRPVARRPGGYRVLAVAGLPDVGGVDLDAALLAPRRADPPRTPTRRPGSGWTSRRRPADRRHRRHLVEDVRAAKEMLSRATTATVPVPLLELEARVSRDEFDDAGPAAARARRSARRPT